MRHKERKAGRRQEAGGRKGGRGGRDGFSPFFSAVKPCAGRWSPSCGRSPASHEVLSLLCARRQRQRRRSGTLVEQPYEVGLRIHTLWVLQATTARLTLGECLAVPQRQNTYL